MIRSLWYVAGLISLGLGAIGVVLPLLPTVPFVLLAAFCFAKSSDRAHQWLLDHKIFGPMIINWQTHGAIAPKAKRLATLSIGLVFGLSVVMGVPTHVLWIQAAVLSAVLLFIWTRPSA